METIGELKDRIAQGMEAKKYATFTMDEGWKNTSCWQDYYRTALRLGLCTQDEVSRIESSMTEDQWWWAFND